MKFKLIIFLTVLMVAMPLAVSFGQMGDNAVFLGPVYKNDNLGLSFGGAHRIGSGPTWVAGRLSVDKEAAEADGQYFALFEVPGTGLFVGPVAAIGADWISGPTTLQTYMKTAAGAGAAFAVNEQIGGWAFFTYRRAIGNNLYAEENKWLIGIGGYFMF